MNQHPWRTRLSLAFVVAASLTAAGPGGAQPAPSVTPPARTAVVPREKVSLVCQDTYFKAARTDFVLQDEVYPQCTLKLPLTLRDRWKGDRSFYVLPRLSATLYARDARGNGRWLPLSPLVNPGADPLHRVIASSDYRQVELVGRFGKLSDVAGDRTPDTVGAGGKLTVCVSPVRDGETPCITYDVTARFHVYRR